MVKISIIIPVYNAELYIERCINSVLKQTYRNIELILVNDCTSDKSIEIAEEIINREDCFQSISTKILHHAFNRGQSAARNTGLKAATGEYVYYMDSDDEITPDCIEKLVIPLKSEHYDIVTGNFQVIGNDDWKPQGYDRTVIGNDNLVRLFAEGGFGAMPWNKLYNSEYLRRNNLFFYEGILHEDLLWNFQLVCTANTFSSVKDVTYKYYIYPNSSSRAEDKLRKRSDSLQTVFCEMYKFQRSQGRFDFITDNAIRLYLPLYEKTSRQLQGFSVSHYYTMLRKANCLSLMQKAQVYDTFTRRLRYMDFFMPVWLGFAYRYICWTLVRHKARRNDIPFVY